MNEHLTPAERLPELVQDWADIVAQVAAEYGLAPDAARALGAAAALRLTDEYGGRNFYLAQCMSLRLSQRDQEILAAFNGRNYDELASTFKKSVRHIRRLVRRAKAADLLTRQGDFFPEGRSVPNRR